jgi:hypothetical protein
VLDIAVLAAVIVEVRAHGSPARNGVVMANVIPSGSKSTQDLIGRLGERNLPLLKRILEFPDGLNVEIVRALSPRLMVVPLSLARRRRLCAVRPWGLGLSQAMDSKSHMIVLRRTTSCLTRVLA